MSSIIVRRPWTRQPPYKVAPNFHWIERGLTFASTLSGVYWINDNGLAVDVTGTKVVAAHPINGRARGFNTTLGSGSTDVIGVTGFNYGSGPKTVLVWARTRAAGGSSLGRILDDSVFFLYYNAGAITVQLNRSSVSSEFKAPVASGLAIGGVGNHLAVRYDSTSTSNVADIFFGGVKQTLSSSTGGSGSVSTPSYSLRIGNNAAGNRVWDGLLADVAFFDALLTDQEISTLRSPGALWGTRRVLVPYVASVSAAPTVTALSAINITASSAQPRISYS